MRNGVCPVGLIVDLNGEYENEENKLSAKICCVS